MSFSSRTGAIRLLRFIESGLRYIYLLFDVAPVLSSLMFFSVITVVGFVPQAFCGKMSAIPLHLVVFESFSSCFWKDFEVHLVNCVATSIHFSEIV